MISEFINLYNYNLVMTHTLIIRGFNDQVHEKLREIANQRGVSINSIVKDAVDMWLKKRT
jgi:predicted HicB family RNase H-like nuclease